MPQFNKKILNNKTVLITGGTGSFGNYFLDIIINNFNCKKIIIFSRDEMKQWNMRNKYQKHKNLFFIIGDVKEKDSLLNAFKNVDIIIHAAATKIVPTAEENPFECIKTNILGAMNIVSAAIEQKVSKIVALSTDKASSPINLYGASKLCSDKLFVSGNFLNSNKFTKMSVVRYGNVMGSRGSVIPFFLSLKNKKILPITNIEMTRFMISLEDAVNLVLTTIETMSGGEIYVKKIPSMKVIDIAKAINPKAKFKIIGIRPGEKIHEQMIGKDDALSTFEFKDYYKIVPQIKKGIKKMKLGKKVKKDFFYSSENNKEWMEVEYLAKWLLKNKDNFIQ
jgi:UDP-N-acetylglucosamine 4,6-dehydratase (inverting)